MKERKAESSIKELEQTYKGQHKSLSAILLSFLIFLAGDGGQFIVDNMRQL